MINSGEVENFLSSHTRRLYRNEDGAWIGLKQSENLGWYWTGTGRLLVNHKPLSYAHCWSESIMIERHCCRTRPSAQHQTIRKWKIHAQHPICVSNKPIQRKPKFYPILKAYQSMSMSPCFYLILKRLSIRLIHEWAWLRLKDAGLKLWTCQARPSGYELLA